MNKYQAALNEIKGVQAWDDGLGEYWNVFDKNDENIKLIQELVDKATPKKPIVEGGVVCEKDTFCPSCRINVSLRPSSKPPYCWCCGQALDWNKKHE